MLVKVHCLPLNFLLTEMSNRYLLNNFVSKTAGQLLKTNRNIINKRTYKILSRYKCTIYKQFLLLKT